MADEIVDLHYFPCHQIQRLVDPGSVLGSPLTALLGVAHGIHHRLSAPLQTGQHGLDLRRALLGTGREGAHLVCHHRKATPLLASTGRLDGCVEGQQVGLFGNAADHPQHGANLLHILLHCLNGAGGLLYLVHQRHHAGHGLIHHLPGLARQLLALAGKPGRAGCTLGDGDRGAAHLVDGGHHLLGLAHMVSQQGLGGTGLTGQPLDTAVELTACLPHLSHHLLQPLDKAVDPGRDLAEVILAGHRQPASEIAAAARELQYQIPQREDGAIGHIERQHRQHHHHDRHTKQRHDDLAVEGPGHGLDVIEVDVAGQRPAAAADIQLIGARFALPLRLAVIEAVALTVGQREVATSATHLLQQAFELAHVEVVEIGGIGAARHQNGDDRLAIHLLQRADGDLVVGGGDQLAQSIDLSAVVDDPAHVECHVADHLDDVVKAGLLQGLLDVGHPEVEVGGQQDFLIDVAGQLIFDQGDLFVDVVGGLSANVATDEVVDAEPSGADGDQNGQ